ncbi:MAG TPA: urease accessory protein UreE [Polyangiales bacterium]|nr:urease accessory protein UreE [Polyangiales bacterium]
MLRVESRAEPNSTPTDTLRLVYDDRKKSRVRVWSELGREVAVLLSRGSALRDGDLLAANSGEVLLVRAKPETVSEAWSSDWALLTRAAYHLGNRHVALQIEPGVLRYQHDHVLDGMLEGMGLGVRVVERAFEPEGGAYGAAGSAHGHGHKHEHEHEHEHEHD